MTDRPIVDLRIYTIQPRRLPEFLRIYEELGLPVAVKHLNPPIGFYTSLIGTLNQVVHLWAFASLADMEARFAGLYADADFAPYLTATTGMVVAQEDRVIRRVEFKSLPGLLASGPG